MNGKNVTSVMEMQSKIEKIRPYMSYIGELRKVIAEAEALDLARARIHNALFGGRTTRERLEAVRKVHGGWRGVDRAKGIVKRADSGEHAIAKLSSPGVIRLIGRDDPILARMILNIGANPKELRLLGDLRKDVENKDRAKAIAILLQPERFAYYENGLKKFGDEELANNLLTFLAYIRRIDRVGSEKMGFIENFMRTISGWKVDAAYLDRYAELVRQFIAAHVNGSVDDIKLADKINRTGVVRHLLSYRRVIGLLRNWLGMVDRGMHSGMWGEVKKFYEGLSDEEKMLHGLGDDRTADLMKAKEEEVHLYPEAWKQLLTRLLEDKQKPEAMRNVIEEAVATLLKILKGRVDELEVYIRERSDTALKVLGKRVNAKIRGIEGGKRTAGNIIKLRENNLRKELAATKKELTKRQHTLYLTAMRFKSIQKIFGGHNIDEIIGKIEALSKSKKEWAKYFFQNLTRIRNDEDAHNFSYVSGANLAAHRLEAIEENLVEEESLSVDIVSNMPLILKEAGLIITEFMKLIRETINFLRKEKFDIKLGGEQTTQSTRTREEVMVNA